MFLEIENQILTYLPLFWLAVLLVAIVVESITNDLVSIWFAASALIIMLVSFFWENLPGQLMVFIVLTVLFVVLARPFLKRYLKVNEVKTNVDTVIGRIAVVTASIEKLSRGEVKLDASYWTAVTDEDELINVGDKVEVLAVEGVKLIVRKIK